ncbi:hypothetical protein [Rhodococcus sp. B10]|uniref:hypothetical protein n=1 Tax=Rhodococcus sp. B10 TaxID=2695876 RepID=UPI001431362F|nr:hypothetical protein [Rhodococcus sp. B10]NIL77182.1 hypothetical protein [Rhodococcus sp. B10]
MTTLLIFIGVVLVAGIICLLVRPLEIAFFLGRMAGKAQVKWDALRDRVMDSKRRQLRTRGQVLAEAANVIERQAQDRAATLLAFRAALKAERERKI